MESPFDVLGVDPDADEATIKRAYKRRVKEAHPDHGGSAEAFQRVRSAYEAIKAGDVEAIDVDQTGVADTDDEADETEPTSRVEYLNYEVIEDHGWDLSDEDLFEKAAAADLDSEDYGEIRVGDEPSLLVAAEKAGFAWPYACRGGACANCAIAVLDGDSSMPVDHILPSEMLDRGFRLSCVGKPVTDDMKIVYNVKHLPELHELRLPPRPFERANLDD
ncbi:MAG: ferredoxin Fer [Natronomonas sp.]